MKKNNKIALDYIKRVDSTIEVDHVLSHLRFAGKTVINTALKYESSDDKDCAFEQVDSLLDAMYYIGAVSNILKTFKS